MMLFLVNYYKLKVKITNMRIKYIISMKGREQQVTTPFIPKGIIKTKKRNTNNLHGGLILLYLYLRLTSDNKIHPYNTKRG